MTQTPGEQCRVLIVHHDEVMRTLVVDLLEPQGYEVASVNDCGDALEMLKSFEPDLVVSSASMPGLDGLGLSRHIKEKPQTSGVAVLLMSGDSDGQHASVECLTAGADDYVDQPFRLEELLIK